MKKLIGLLIIGLILSSCSNKNNETVNPENKTEQPSELYADWFVGQGQFNGSLDFGTISNNQNKVVVEG